MVKSEGSDISGASNFDESERFKKEDESDWVWGWSGNGTVGELNKYLSNK
jgi:hypothetical protein